MQGPVAAPACELAVGPESRYTRSTSRPRGRRHVAKKKVTRKLGAILATEMAGYSRLVGVDEEDTELLDPKTSEHGERIANAIGELGLPTVLIQESG